MAITEATMGIPKSTPGTTPSTHRNRRESQGRGKLVKNASQTTDANTEEAVAKPIGIANNSRTKRATCSAIGGRYCERFQVRQTGSAISSFNARCCSPRRTCSSIGRFRSKCARARNQLGAPLRGYPSAASRTSPACIPALSIGPPGNTLATLKRLGSGTHPPLAGPQNSCRVLNKKASTYTTATTYVHHGAPDLSIGLLLPIQSRGL